MVAIMKYVTIHKAVNIELAQCKYNLSLLNKV